MDMINELTQSLALSSLRYIESTGELFWTDRDRSLFKTDGSFKQYHTLYAGKPALTNISSDGYRGGRLFGKTVKAHRVIWLLLYGEFPSHGYEIDHINGNRLDNRAENLRLVTRKENTRNRKRPSTNKSGVIGVHWCKRSEKWCAQIKHNDKRVHLGYFDSLLSAKKARRRAEEGAGYHKNHGRNLPVIKD